MTIFRVVPLDMITAPNFFGYLRDFQWTIVGNNPVVLWFQFQVSDTLGTRRYTVATPGTVALTFLRADTAGVSPSAPPVTFSTQTPVAQTQTIYKVATPYTTDRSLYSISLTAQETATLTSGTVQVTLTENNQPITFNQNYLVKKTLAVPGA